MDTDLKTERFKKMLQYVSRLNPYLLCDHFNKICELACACNDKHQTYPHLPSSTTWVYAAHQLLLQPPHD